MAREERRKGMIKASDDRRGDKSVEAGARSREASGQATHMRALTGLRFVAALLVVLFHFMPWSVLDHPGAPGPVRAIAGAVLGVVRSGFTGVSFFFILSGFILAYTYLGPAGRRKGRSPRHFWLARLARVYPLYLVAFLLAAVPFFLWGGSRGGQTMCDGHQNPVVTAVASLLLVQAWIPCSASVLNQPGWSLSVEAFFYLTFPLLALPLARLGRRGLLLVAAAAWATLAAVALAYTAIAPDGPIGGVSWHAQFWHKTLYMSPLARLPEFVMGVALGALFLRSGAESGARTPPRGVIIALLPLLALAGVVVALTGGPLPVVLFNGVLLDPLFALLIYSLAWVGGWSPLAWLLASPPLLLLGEASYAIYILHWPLWDWTSRYLKPLVPTLATREAFFAAYLGIVVAAAVLSYRVIERPARRALLRLFERGPASRRTEVKPIRPVASPVRRPG